MDVQVLSNLITNAGFSIGIAVYLLLDQKKKDKENQKRIEQKEKENKEMIEQKDKESKEYINIQVNDLRQRLEESEEEGKKDKAMFSEALSCFNRALEKFDGIEEMKEDISVVVEKVDKMQGEVDKVNTLLTENIKNKKGDF